MASPFNYIEVMQQVKQTIFTGDHSAIYNIACAVACIAAGFSLITWYNRMLNDPYGRLDMRSIIRALIVLFMTCNFYNFVLIPFDHITYLVARSVSASVDENRKDAYSYKEIIRQVEKQRGEESFVGNFLREMDGETSSESADGSSLSFDTSATMASEAEVNIAMKPKKGLGAKIWQGMKDAFSAIVSFPVYSVGSVLGMAITIITKIVQWVLTAVSAIYLIILGLVGPIVFALSLLPGFRKGVHNWIARYIQISFWVPMASLVDYVNYKITGALVVAMFNNPSLSSGVYIIHLIVLELITLVCLLGVPSLSAWVISSAGASDLNSKVISAAQKAVMVAGKL